MSTATAHPPRTLRLLARGVRALLWLVAAGVLLLGLGAVVLHGFIVPRIGDWRPQLETLASRALGQSVRIGAIAATGSGWVPSMTLHGLQVRNAAGQTTLQVERVQAALSARALWRLGLEQLVLDGATLHVQRTAQGQWLVAGVPVVPSSDSAPPRWLDWFFSQPEWVLRGGQLHWHDEMAASTTAAEVWHDLTLVQRNAGRAHDFRLDVQPPAHWGQRLSLRGQLLQPLWQLNAAPWQDWAGTLYAETDGLNLAAFSPYLKEHLPPDQATPSGQGALRAWLEVAHGSITGLTADVALRDALLPLAPARPPLPLQHLSGRLRWQHDGAQQSWATEGLALRTASGLDWPGGNVRYSQTRTTPTTGQNMAPTTAHALDAEQLDLALLHQLADHLPLPASVAPPLASLQPQGRVRSLHAQWRSHTAPDAAGAGTASNATALATTMVMDWHVQGDIRDLTLAAAPATSATTGTATPADAASTPGRPGIHGLQLQFDARPDSGQAQLALAPGGSINVPGVLEPARIPFDQLQADVRWQSNQGQWTVRVPQLRFANADMAGSASGRWQTGTTPASRLPGRLDLQAQLQRANAARVYRYLPVVIPASVRHYVQQAVPRGQARSASFKVQGDLADFPFERPGSGVFSVRAALSGVDLVYVPPTLTEPGSLPWPPLERVQAELQIDGAALRIAHGSGRALSLPQLHAQRAEARIDNFLLDDPVLHVQADVAGPASDAVAFVNQSPLRGMTDGALQHTRIDGNAQVQFGLTLPLNHVAAVQVRGDVQLPGNTLQITPDTPTLHHTQAQLHFNESGFDLTQARSQLLGGELQFSGQLRTPNGTPHLQFSGQGSASADGLRHSPDWPLLAPLGQLAQGSARYQVALDITPGGTEVQVDTDLQGLAVDLPAPLGKTARTAQPLRYQVRRLPSAPPSDAPTAPLHDELTLSIGPATAPLLHARYQREHQDSTTRVLRGTLQLHDPAIAPASPPALPTQGVQAQAQLGTLDVAAWQQRAQAWLAEPTSPQTAATALATATTAPGQPTHSTDGYLPRQWQLNAQQLLWRGQRWHHVALQGQHRAPDRWQLQLDAQEASGTLHYDRNAHRLHARLQRLQWITPPQGKGTTSPTLDANTRLPELDVQVQALALDGRALGQLELHAQHDHARNVWQLQQLALLTPEAQWHSQGQWDAARQRTDLQLQLQLHDAGQWLSRLGRPGVLRGGRGQLTGQLHWAGPPLGTDWGRVHGELQLALAQGQLLQIEPGLARWLGVLNLQALPRRLSLDFDDVLNSGFSFDLIAGSAQIAQGVARTSDLRLQSVNAAALLQGQVDLARKTQDLQAVAVPHLNADTVSLVATAINPALGLSSFAWQWLLRQPLQYATTQRWHISGSWQAPHIEKLPHPASTSSPATPAAAAANALPDLRDLQGAPGTSSPTNTPHPP